VNTSAIVSARADANVWNDGANLCGRPRVRSQKSGSDLAVRSFVTTPPHDVTKSAPQLMPEGRVLVV
jgi:hypothetical protein